MSKPRLLAIGQGFGATGYGRVMESILGRMNALEPALFAVDHHGPVPARGFDVRTNEMPGDPYGREQLPMLLAEIRPDVVLIHNDGTHFAIHRDVLARYERARVVVYCPVDWAQVRAAVPRALAGADRVVTYTRYGERVLREAFANAGVAAPPLSVIPHGVDRERFRALDSYPVDERFVVLNANRNIARKRIDLTLRGFAEFARDREDAFLYLHMGMRDRGFDLVGMARELGIEDRVVTTTRTDARPRIADEELNSIYASCDVGLNTAEAEGWGLVSFEHAATGAPQVVPDGSACAELWDEQRGALRLPTTPTERGGHEVAPADVAAALARLYDDRQLLGELGARAHAYAMSPEFDWDAITRAWEDVLLEVIAGG